MQFGIRPRDPNVGTEIEEESLGILDASSLFSLLRSLSPPRGDSGSWHTALPYEGEAAEAAHRAAELNETADQSDVRLWQSLSVSMASAISSSIEAVLGSSVADTLHRILPR